MSHITYITFGDLRKAFERAVRERGNDYRPEPREFSGVYAVGPNGDDITAHTDPATCEPHTLTGYVLHAVAPALFTQIARTGDIESFEPDEADPKNYTLNHAQIRILARMVKHQSAAQNPLDKMRVIFEDNTTLALDLAEHCEDRMGRSWGSAAIVAIDSFIARDPFEVAITIIDEDDTRAPKSRIAQAVEDALSVPAYRPDAHLRMRTILTAGLRQHQAGELA